MIPQFQKDQLITEIDKKREEMIAAAESMSYTSCEVVRFSQELDELLNQFQQIEWAENESSTSLSKFVNRMASWRFSTEQRQTAAEH
ncbi:aspartyl-phosphate phosphatase Spo0E family protein [Metabacillus sp. 84]|uniref:aspartyl-phosphate phosphatase Spo0E family protein n=1 Tax=unclassified Metabacillus TaxID=2675274 RepID=UPI003CF9628F